MEGRHSTNAGHALSALSRRLLSWFEALPFRRGVVILVGALLVPVLVMGGIFVFGGGSGAAAPDPSQGPTTVSSSPTHKVRRHPHRVKPTRSVVGTRTVISTPPTPTRTKHRTRYPSPRSKTTSSCPPGLRNLPWMWQICNGKRDGQKRD